MPVTALTFTQAFVEGFAQLIATEADPALALDWQPAARYATGKTGLYIATFPTDVAGQPNVGTAVALTPYPISDDSALADSEIGLQIKSRAAGPDKRDVWAIDDGIADVLLGRWSFTLPTGIAVSSLTRSSSGSLGNDDANRAQWVSNYTALLNRPSAHRL